MESNKYTLVKIYLVQQIIQLFTWWRVRLWFTKYTFLIKVLQSAFACFVSEDGSSYTSPMYSLHLPCIWISYFRSSLCLDLRPLKNGDDLPFTADYRFLHKLPLVTDASLSELLPIACSRKLPLSRCTNVLWLYLFPFTVPGEIQAFKWQNRQRLAILAIYLR